MSDWKHYPDAPHPNPYDDTRPPDPDDLCPVCEKIRCECPPESDVHADAIEALDQLEDAQQ